ncbi:MAG TPA: cupin domain-containing protein [Gemmatimonadota bacterium]|nr:cupin domain-containing protein [Gemmatimonadota bacterium]
MRLIKTMALLAIFLPATALAQSPAPAAPVEGGPHDFKANDAIGFTPFELPGFDSGIQLAVVHGDPMAASGDYAIRLLFPDGYRFPAHHHPSAEHVTVLTGTFLVGMGADENPDTVEGYTPGSYLYFPPGENHYGGATGQTVIQVEGQAPFKVVLANAGT